MPDVNPSRIAATGGTERRLRVLVVDDHEGAVTNLRRSAQVWRAGA